MLEEVKAGKRKTEYSHLNTELDEGYMYNCYGFIDRCVMTVAPEARQEIVDRMMELRDEVPPSFDGIPCPFNNVSILERGELHYWEQVLSLEDIRPGDIVIYLPTSFTPRFSPDERKGKKTGTHMMVIQYALGRQGEEYAFTIINSTQSSHCTQDSRYGKGNGVGSSPLFLKPIDGMTCILRWGTREKVYDKRIIVARLKQRKRGDTLSSKPKFGESFLLS